MDKLRNLLLLSFLFSTSGFILIACTEETIADDGEQRLETVHLDERSGTGSNQITIFRDRETNCQYMHIDDQHGQVLTAMVQADGKPYCQ